MDFRVKRLWLNVIFSLLPLLLIGCSSFIKEDVLLYSLSGEVLDAKGRGIEGVIIYKGPYETTITNKDGLWSIRGLKGTNEITPVFEREGQPYLFVPQSRTIHRESELHFIGYPQSPMGEEIEFTSREPLAFEGGIIIDGGLQVIPEGVTIMVLEITEIESLLTWDLKPAGKMIEIRCSDFSVWSKGVQLRIPLQHVLDAPYGGLYYYHDEKREWVKEKAFFEDGAFIATVHHFTIYGVLKEDIVYQRDSTIPYIHQVYGTNPNLKLDGFNGIHACGPTSAVMILTYFHRLPLEGSFSTPEEYIYRSYEAYAGTFYREVSDPNTDENHLLGEKRGEGAWGAMYVPGAGACIIRAKHYLEAHHLSVEAVGVGEATISKIIQALEENKILWASVVGHIVVVKGFVEYSSGEKRLILHDPWGDPRKDREKYYSSSYYREDGFQRDEGAHLLFSWEELIKYYSSPNPSPHGTPNPYGIGNMLIVGENHRD